MGPKLQNRKPLDFQHIQNFPESQGLGYPSKPNKKQLSLSTQQGFHYYCSLAKRSCGRVVRQRSAKPCTAVQIRSGPLQFSPKALIFKAFGGFRRNPVEVFVEVFSIPEPCFLIPIRIF